MSQEVKVLLQLTLEVDTKLDKKDIEKTIKLLLENEDNWYLGFCSPNLINIIEIQEEAEIYGSET